MKRAPQPTPGVSPTFAQQSLAALGILPSALRMAPELSPAVLPGAAQGLPQPSQVRLQAAASQVDVSI